MPKPVETAPRSIIGMGRLARYLAGAQDPGALWAELRDRLATDVTDANTLFDMGLLLRLMGKAEQSDLMQSQALYLNPIPVCRHGAGDGLRVVVFVTGGDVLSNAPIDLLCEETNLTLYFLHVDAMADLVAPAHDVAFVAVGYSEINAPALQRLSTLLPAWPRPVMNDRPERVLALTRDGVSALFSDCDTVQAPANVKLDRGVVEQLSNGAAETGYPVLIRPLDSHGGKGLEKIDHAGQWRDYLDRYPDAEFFLTPFVDYSGADGLYRKLRITFIDGRPFAVHMAISNHWLVHYISSGMMESTDRRAEEAAWMADFDTDFAVRHADALRAIAERIGVDYVSIDCAETRDGRLLLFEADVASIVHSLDSVELFPYKRPAMAKLFTAFQHALERRAEAPAAKDAA